MKSMLRCWMYCLVSKGRGPAPISDKACPQMGELKHRGMDHAFLFATLTDLWLFTLWQFPCPSIERCHTAVFGHPDRTFAVKGQHPKRSGYWHDVILSRARCRSNQTLSSTPRRLSAAECRTPSTGSSRMSRAFASQPTSLPP